MKILLEAHHPAHIHFWKYPIRELQARGHEVLMIGRDRDVMKHLLEVYDWIPYEIPKRKNRDNRFPLVEMLERQWAVARAIRRFKPDVVASLMGSYTQSAKLFGVRNIIFTDSEFQHFNHRIAHPFADEIYTPECFYKDLGPKQRRYNGIHELSFLHPSVFDLDPAVLKRYPQLKPEGYIVIRLSAWNTLHDRNHSGIGDRIYDFVEEFKKEYQLVISAEEGKIPSGLRAYALELRPEDFHQILGQARLVLSEGASTASEAACLGVPCAYINDTESRGYLKMIESRYQVTRSFSDPVAGLSWAKDELNDASIDFLRKKIVVRRQLEQDFCPVYSLVTKLLLAH
ncbi:MAG: DUF354 domain-containing protein [Opitutales bacterium]